MNFDRINQWLTLIANMGILAGIVFLALEIQQNTRATKISSLDATLSQWNHFREHIIQDREVAELWKRGIAAEELDGADSTRFDVLVTELMFTMQAHYFRSREATITEDSPEILGQPSNALRATPGFVAGG